MTEYKLILELARHGARAPSEMYDFTTPEQDNFPAVMELTPLGVSQHYTLGEYVRGKYFADDPQLSSKTMKEALVYAQSTNKNRTLQSATSQLQGLWGTATTWPALDPETYPVVRDVNEDKLIVISSHNCERFKQVEDDVAASEEWKSLFETKMGKDLLRPNVYDWLTEKTGEDLDLLKMSDVATYVHLARYHGMELTFEVSEEHFKWCQAASDQFTYEWFGATEELWQLASRQQLKLLSELIDVVFDGATPAGDSVLSTNLYAPGLYSAGELPYFWLLLGHQETLWPLSKALGLEVAAKLPFATSFFFEFMTKDNKDYVNLVHRDDQGEVENVQLGCSASATETACEKAAFKTFIGAAVTKAYEVDCDTDSPDTNLPYYDVEKFISELLEDLDLTDTRPKAETDSANWLQTIQFATASLLAASAFF